MLAHEAQPPRERPQTRRHSHRTTAAAAAIMMAVTTYSCQSIVQKSCATWYVSQARHHASAVL